MEVHHLHEPEQMPKGKQSTDDTTDAQTPKLPSSVYIFSNLRTTSRTPQGVSREVLYYYPLTITIANVITNPIPKPIRLRFPMQETLGRGSALTKNYSLNYNYASVVFRSRISWQSVACIWNEDTMNERVSSRRSGRFTATQRFPESLCLCSYNLDTFLYMRV